MTGKGRGQADVMQSRMIDVLCVHETTWGWVEAVTIVWIARKIEWGEGGRVHKKISRGEKSVRQCRRSEVESCQRLSPT